MTATISKQQIDQLLTFQGYGKLDADIWFLFSRQLLSSDEALLKMAKYQTVEDLVHSSGVGVLRGLPEASEVMLRLAGKNPTQLQVEDYLQKNMGRPHGAAFLCPIMLFDEKAMGMDVLAGLFPQFDTPTECLEFIRKTRRETITDLLQDYSPKVVVACGEEGQEDFRSLFGDFDFNTQEGFLIGWDSDTVAILVPDLDSAEMDGKIEALVKLIQENALSIDTTLLNETPILSRAEIARQKKAAAKAAAAARRKPAAVHDPADPYCVCAYCLGYEGDQ